MSKMIRKKIGAGNGKQQKYLVDLDRVITCFAGGDANG